MNKETGQIANEPSSVRGGVLRKNWWVLALVVLVVLVGVIYLLSRLSAADSEMYPTTMLRQQLANLNLC